ncbi:MAG: hypothetical protein JWO05_1232 [Gemmatimonadetes bacterium]|nr:hypothetical protein [Gemmatimonadota bacterium]
MTQRLYYEDARLAEFHAVVTEVSASGREVYLDRSAFYPTSGGQPHDTGTLDAARVVDVVDEDDRVSHHVVGPVPAVGDRVHGTIDWPRRLDHMQQHTGQHLLSALLDDHHGMPTLSVHFGDERATLDVREDASAPQLLRGLEQRANEVIAENREVRVSFADSSLVGTLRKPTARSGSIRIVEIDGIDRSACGGTHVSRTGEIGAVLLRDVERVREGTRISFTCGLRAVRASRQEFEALSTASRVLSAQPLELSQAVSTQLSRLEALEKQLRRVRDERDALHASALHAGAVQAEGGWRRIVVRFPSATAEEMTGLGQKACAMGAVTFIGMSEEPAAVVYGASEGLGLHAGQLLRSALQSSGGRGGGSPRMAQGVVADPSQLEVVLALLP